MKYLNLHSREKGKVPQPSQLKDGEIGLNHAKDGEAIFIKNSDDEIVAFFPFDKGQYYTKTEVDTTIENAQKGGGVEIAVNV